MKIKQRIEGESFTDFQPTPKEILKMKETLNPDEYYKFIRDKDVSLDELKNAKKNQLDYLCNQTILSGFYSSATGEEHFYPADEEAQRNLNFAIKRLELQPELGTVGFKTLDAGYINHTLEQIHQVFKDGFDYGQQQIIKYNQLKIQVYDSTTDTPEKIDAIVW